MFRITTCSRQFLNFKQICKDFLRALSALSMTTPIYHVSDKIVHEIKGGVGSRMVRGSSDSSRLKLERSFTFWAAGGSGL